MPDGKHNENISRIVNATTKISLASIGGSDQKGLYTRGAETLISNMYGNETEVTSSICTRIKTVVELLHSSGGYSKLLLRFLPPPEKQTGPQWLNF